MFSKFNWIKFKNRFKKYFKFKIYLEKKIFFFNIKLFEKILKIYLETFLFQFGTLF
jgi:hypothetical protein